MTDTAAPRLVIVSRDDAEPSRIAVAGGVAVVASRAAPDRETPGDNQDAAGLLLVDDTRGVLAVADGVGGTPGGGRASQVAVESALAAFLAKLDDTAALRDLLVGALDAANEQVLALGGGAATTLTLAAIDDDTLRVCNVGDSEALVCGLRGKVKYRTTSHSPVGYAVEAGFLDPEEALRHEERHVVSNTVGSTSMSLDLGAQLRMARYDTVLLGSDGLFDNLLPGEIVEIARKGDPARAAAALADLARRRMTAPSADSPSKSDDMTLILFRRRRPSP